MKSNQSIETVQRALEILKNLMQQDMSVDEILALLSAQSGCAAGYTRELVYKYLNTLVCIPASFAMTFVTSLYQKTGSYDLAYTIMIPISIGILICVLLMNKRIDLTAEIED